ncbi:alkaline phosphatase [Parathalassolituus penaei]|uniref:Alkaline phosphatase n=1 Tax=Parathalassolituus penaei TaxID=2997323 RepID=A0A9X3EKD6_9GAMM|nr:alkaline phosphatase [Parathalassolituus penaei]MCY0964258.1 alkaline phosphatase [Parathalassolituus penaei]
MSTSSSEWFKAGSAQASQKMADTQITGQARNIVLVIGDGMGISTLTAARIFAGQQKGMSGEDYSLSFEKLPYSALIKTYNTNQQTPDSAGTMSAIVTGTKTLAGVLSVDATVTRDDCNSGKGHELNSLLDLAEDAGKATGVLTTTRLTHATPAATYAHSVDRDWEDDRQMPQAARDAGCIDIASQLIAWRTNSTNSNSNNSDAGLEVAFGGGRAMFLPEQEKGDRADGRDLTREWQQQPDHHYVDSLQALNAADMKSGHWLGLFANSHLPYVDDRGDNTPGLLDMTRKAVERLSQNQNGYVLVIEAGRIDHAHHEGKGYRALKETEELDQTMNWLIDHLDFNNSLLLVTADHSHTLTLAGYPTLGNPITGVVKTNDEHGHPRPDPVKLSDGGYYTSMNYRNGPGAVSQPRPSVNPDNTSDPDYRQQALVELESETHGGEDVAVYGRGPWAHLLGGTMEQHWLFHLMKQAMTSPAQ